MFVGKLAMTNNVNATCSCSFEFLGKNSFGFYTASLLKRRQVASGDFYHSGKIYMKTPEVPLICSNFKFK